MKMLRGALRASHFGPTLLVTSISLLLAFYFGYGWKSGLVAITIFGGQLIVGWTNDIFDIQLSIAQNDIVWTVAQGRIIVLEDVTD